MANGRPVENRGHIRYYLHQLQHAEQCIDQPILPPSATSLLHADQEKTFAMKRKPKPCKSN
eukprot:1033533-Pyramimonas_sp.AAC.1